MLTGGWWMYYVEFYFPLMYAILTAELKVSEGKIDAIYLEEIKQKLKEEYESLVKTNKNSKLLLDERDIDHLMKIDMTYEYKPVLLRSVWEVGTEERDMSNKLLDFLDNLIGTYK